MSETSLENHMVDDFIVVHELDTTEMISTLARSSPERYVVILASTEDDPEDVPVKMATVAQIRERGVRGTVSQDVLKALLPLAQSTVSDTFAGDLIVHFTTMSLTDSMKEIYASLTDPDRYVLVLNAEGLPDRLTTAREMKRKMPRRAQWPLVSDLADRLPQASWIEESAPDLAAALLKEEMDRNRTQALVVTRGQEIAGLVPAEQLERLRLPRYRQYMKMLPDAALAPAALTLQQALAYMPLFIKDEFKDSPGLVVMQGQKVAGILSYETLAEEYNKRIDQQIATLIDLGEKVQVNRSVLSTALANLEASALYRCRRHPRCSGKEIAPLVDGPPLCNVTAAHGRMVLVE